MAGDVFAFVGLVYSLSAFKSKELHIVDRRSVCFYSSLILSSAKGNTNSRRKAIHKILSCFES
jgi:hypothetical protein